jgi:hypothetical protein
MVKTGTAAGGKGGLKELGGVKGAVRRGAAWCLEAAAAVRDRGRGVLKWGVKVGGTVSFALATTSMIVLMPLLFEIAREGQVRSTIDRSQCTNRAMPFAMSRTAACLTVLVFVLTGLIILIPLSFRFVGSSCRSYSYLSSLQMLETERAQIKDLKGKGYSDRQLQEMGFSENALHSPSVASLKA